MNVRKRASFSSPSARQRPAVRFYSELVSSNRNISWLRTKYHRTSAHVNQPVPGLPCGRGARIFAQEAPMILVRDIFQVKFGKMKEAKEI
jgi:hypothetical protein